MDVVKTILAVGVVSAVAFGGLKGVGRSYPEPVVIKAHKDAPDMEAARQRARASLSDFWSHYERPRAGERRFMLKVSLPDDNGSREHIWIDAVRRLDDGRFSGRLGNDPVAMKKRKAGDLVTFEKSQIDDWMFLRNDKIVGNETMRPLLTRMPAEQAARYKALYETP